MTAITKEQLNQYISYNCVTHPCDASFEDARKAVEKDLYSDRHCRNLKYYVSVRSDKIEQYRQVFIKTATHYIELGDQETNPLSKAYLYAVAHRALDIRGYDHYEMRDLKVSICFKEAQACATAVISEKSLSANEKASLLFQSTYLLKKDVEDAITSTDNEKPIVYAKCMLAVESWEMLGELFLKHKKEIEIHAMTFRHIFPFSDRPKRNAVTCFLNADEALHKANFLKQSSAKVWFWNDLHERRIEILNKGINVMETIGLKIKDLFFNADFHQTLARLYGTKHSTYELGKRTDVDYSDLKANVLDHSLQSSDLYKKILQEHNTYTEYCYNIASNLVRASYAEPVPEKAQALMEQAASAAMQYLNGKQLSLVYVLGTESEDESAARAIVFTYLSRYARGDYSHYVDALTAQNNNS